MNVGEIWRYREEAKLAIRIVKIRDATHRSVVGEIVETHDVNYYPIGSRSNWTLGDFYNDTPPSKSECDCFWSKHPLLCKCPK